MTVWRDNRIEGAAGFTLVELVIIIVILGIVATVAVPRFVDMAESSRRTATLQEMQALRRAIVGNPDIVAGGQVIDRGFEGDVGSPPDRLQDLVARPDSIPAYDPLTRLGWNGPYIDGTGTSYLNDSWDQAYAYDPAGRTIVSTGGTDSIAVAF